MRLTPRTPTTSSTRSSLPPGEAVLLEVVAAGGEVVGDDLRGREDGLRRIPTALPGRPLHRSREPRPRKLSEPGTEGVRVLLDERPRGGEEQNPSDIAAKQFSAEE